MDYAPTDDDYRFNVDIWAPFLADLDVCSRYSIYPLSNQEIVAIQNGMMPLLRRLQAWVIQCINANPEGMFFRLGTRSPKDVWKQCATHLEDNIDAQIALCRITSMADILRLCKYSERMIDDMRYHLEKYQGTQSLCIVLAPWRPRRGIEWRCFYRQDGTFAACSYWCDDATTATIPTSLVSFVKKVAGRLSALYDRMVVDVEVDGDNLWLIELNPWSEGTDPILWTWHELDALPSGTVAWR